MPSGRHKWRRWPPSRPPQSRGSHGHVGPHGRVTRGAPVDDEAGLDVVAPRRPLVRSTGARLPGAVPDLALAPLFVAQHRGCGRGLDPRVVRTSLRVRGLHAGSRQHLRDRLRHGRPVSRAGLPIGLLARTTAPRAQRIGALLVLLPFWTSALVKNFAWLVLLGRNGIVATTLAALGWSVELLFGRGTVVFGMTHALLPLAIVTMMPVMARIDTRLPRAAATLGASGGHAFWRVFFRSRCPGSRLRGSWSSSRLSASSSRQRCSVGARKRCSGRSSSCRCCRFRTGTSRRRWPPCWSARPFSPV